MSRGALRSAFVMLLLVGGISAFFATRPRGEEGSDPAGSAGEEEPLSVLEVLAPRLRGLPSTPEGEITARGLVDGALDSLAESPRAMIRTALGSADWGAQWAALLAIPRYGPSDEVLSRGLRLALESDVLAVRRTAAEAAAYVDPARFAPLESGLERAAGDGDPRVRAAALHTLARRSERRVELVPLFAAALGDTDADARAAGAYGLAQIELQEQLEDAVIADLRPRLARALTDPSTDVVVYAVMALGRAGPAAAPEVPALLPLLEDERALVRGQAATAIGSIGSAALPYLEARLERGMGRGLPSLLWALRQMGPPAFPLLLRASAHEQAVVRVLAAQKLWERDHEVEHAIDVLIDALRGADTDAQRIAARTFARMGPEAVRALPALEALREHADETVRDAAAAAVERLQSIRSGR